MILIIILIALLFGSWLFFYWFYKTTKKHISKKYDASFIKTVLMGVGVTPSMKQLAKIKSKLEKESEQKK